MLEQLTMKLDLSSASTVSADGSSLSYAELDRASNRLARYLIRHGAGRDIPVALWLDRSPDFVVAALAVLKAGAAYLPLDTTTPQDRARAILTDAGAPILLSHRSKAAGLAGTSGQTIDLDSQRDVITSESAKPIASDTAPSDLAYIIYTSGSTGTPKGVEITHAGLDNLIAWHNQAFQITAADHAGQFAGLGFDAAVWEIWPYLAAGASIRFTPDLVRKDPEALRDWVIANRITIIFTPPAIAERLIELPWPAETALRTLLTGADTLHRRPPSNLPFKLVNNYGPTECAVVSTSGEVAATGAMRPSIGWPIANTRVYIMNERLQPVEPGEPGELCIAGPGVARGYRNRPDLTGASFVADPADPAARMYRTGDRVSLLPEGDLAFLGRIDSQIKIRGYRIEPDEIVSALTTHASIRAAAVVAREQSAGDRELVAYVVPRPGAKLGYLEVRQYLTSALPDYMIPTVFVQVADLPLNASGKCDKAALPAPTAANTIHEDAPKQAPTNPVEQRIAKEVAGLLGVAAINPNDNFFLMGGHSMMGAQLLARMREIFGVKVTLRQLFSSPSVTALAAVVSKLLAETPVGVA